MKTFLGLGVLVFAIPGPVADDGDDSLRLLLAKSGLVASGEIVSEPAGLILEEGVVNYICEFHPAEVLKGTALPEGTMRVNVIRFEREPADRLPGFRKGLKCILFLKSAGDGETPQWQTADMWFGLQHASPWMSRSLKRLGNPGARPR